MVNDLTLEMFEEVVSNNEVVFIDFYADWCGPCRAMSPVIDEISEERKDVKFFKSNVDENPLLAEKFNVNAIPCFYVIKNKKVSKKMVGLVSKEEILSAL